MFSNYKVTIKYINVLVVSCIISVFIFSNACFAEDNTKVVNEVFNKYLITSTSLGIGSFYNQGRDYSRMNVSSAGVYYKVSYSPSLYLEVSFDYNKQSKQAEAAFIKTNIDNITDNTENTLLFKNNFFILAKLIDDDLELKDINKIYNFLELNKAKTEPKYLKSYISDGYIYTVEAYSKNTSLVTIKIRKSNRADDENISIIEDINSLYSKTLDRLQIPTENIYPEVSQASISVKNLFFFSSPNISMNLQVEKGFRSAYPVSGTITYEDNFVLNNKKQNFSQNIILLLLLTNSNLTLNDANSLVNSLNLDKALTDTNYYNSFADDQKVYTIAYNSDGKLYFSVAIRNSEYDKKATLESLTKNLYNQAIIDLGLSNKVQKLENKNISTSILNTQNSVVFRPSSLMLFRLYFDNKTDAVTRISISLPRIAVDKYLDLQKNNSLIAIKILNPNASAQDAENIFNYLKNAYGVTETKIDGNFRYKRCTYKDETLVFSTYNPQEDYKEGSSLSKDGNNSSISAYNPNLVYEQDNDVEQSYGGKKILIIKPQPLCY